MVTTSRTSKASRPRDDTPLFDPTPDPRWAGVGEFVERDDLGIEPYDFQKAGVIALADGFDRGLCSELYVSPTGTGKTTIFSLLIKYCVERLGWRVLVVAHLDELLHQARGKLASYGVDAAIEKADAYALEEIAEARSRLVDPKDIRVVLASRQSLTKRRLAKTWANKRGFFDLIVIDEAHHATATSYMNIIGWFSDAAIVGATATPKRSDKVDLGDVFQEIVFDYPIRRALAEGRICKPVQRKILDVKIDLKGIDVTKADFDEEELAQRMEANLLPLARAVREQLSDRKTLIFVPKVRVAITLAHMLTGLGLEARAVHGKDPDRKFKANAFERDEFRYLVNCGLYTEGYDCPSIDAVGLFRPTKSVGLLSQMIGRGLRAGKPDCILFDPAWQVDGHKRVMASVWEIFAKPGATPEAIELARERAEQEGEDVDVAAAVDQAALDQAKQDEEKALRANPRIRTEVTYKPTNFTFADFDVVTPGGAPDRGDTRFMTDGPTSWGSTPSVHQVQKLEGLGMPREAAAALPAGKAGRMISLLIERHRQGLASYKQVQMLVGRGLSMEAANAVRKKDVTDLLKTIGGRYGR